MNRLQKLSIKLAKESMDGKKSYELAFNELFFEIHNKHLPKGYRLKIDNKILK